MDIVNNEDIGKYLKKKISKKYESQAEFCKEYLKKTSKNWKNEDSKPLENRISQILKGNKSIQLYDLPVFSDLLGVSYEEIISGGKHFGKRDKRLTNYSVALSNDKKVWEKYINDENKPILNPDEYCKTVLDYAIEYKNFAFIKYLMDRKYIWFQCEEINNFAYDFGAGTSIKGRNIGGVDYYLQHQLSGIVSSEQPCNAALRMKLISLAVENGNLDILKELRAREIPDYYNATFFTRIKIDTSKYFNEELISNIATSSDKIVDYFTDVFEIGDIIKYKDGIKRNHKFMFPFISELLDEMVENNNRLVEVAIKRSIEHNTNTYSVIKTIINEFVVERAEMCGCMDINSDICNEKLKVELKKYSEKLRKENIEHILKDIILDDKKSIISLRGNSSYRNMGIITNIMKIGKESKDIAINNLIKELNQSYEKIINIGDELLNKNGGKDNV